MPPEVVDLQAKVAQLKAAVPALIARAKAGDPAVMQAVGQAAADLGNVCQDILQVVPVT